MKYNGYISEEEVSEYRQILTLLNEKGFLEALQEERDMKWINDNQDFLARKGIEITYGCTKCVIITDNDYVIKVDLPKSGYSYCHKEAMVYEDAVAYGLQKYFAPTYYFTYFETFDFYLQRQCLVDEDAIYESFCSYSANGYSPDEFEDEDEYNETVCSYADQLDWEEAIEAIYGIDKEVNALIKFLSDRKVNDLHSQNFGSLKINGFYDTVMIDYSGY